MVSRLSTASYDNDIENIVEDDSETEIFTNDPTKLINELKSERNQSDLRHEKMTKKLNKNFKCVNVKNTCKSAYYNGELKSIMLSLAFILIYYCFSIFLTFYNRYLFVTYKYPLSITIVHLIFKYMVSSGLRSFLNLTNRSNHKRITLDWCTYFTRIVPTGVASAADIGFSNWSLQYITVTLYTMSKSTVILFIFFFSILFKLEKWRRSIISVVLCISFGLFLFTYHSTEFHVFGFTLVMIASFSAGLRWTLAQAVTQKHELGLGNPIDMIYHIQPGMILCLLPLAVYVEGLSIISTDKFFRSEDLSHIFNNMLWILVGATIAFFLESSEYLVVTYTSSLTLSISGIFKEICTIYLAVVWNHNKLNTMNTFGLIICLIGIGIHIFMKTRYQAEEANANRAKKPTGNKRRDLELENISNQTELENDNFLNQLSTTNSKTSLNKKVLFKKSNSLTGKSDNLYQTQPLLDDENN